MGDLLGKTYIGNQYVEGYTLSPSMIKPASSKQGDKLAWQNKILSVLKEPGLFEALTNNTDVEYRLLVDTFEGYVDENLKKKILIIDDDGAMLRMMKTWFSVKYRVYMASSGKIALSFLAQNQVDLVLLDYEMPVMSGPDVLKDIRNTSKLKDIPVIFLTAKDDKESVMKVVGLKPEKYLLKSMPKEKLIGAIDDFFLSKSTRK